MGVNFKDLFLYTLICIIKYSLKNVLIIFFKLNSRDTFLEVFKFVFKKK